MCLDSQRVLILGHSSNLSYLSYVFSSISHYATTVCLLKDGIEQVRPAEEWKWSIVSASEHTRRWFQPHRTFVNFDEMPQAFAKFDAAAHDYDFVFLGCEFCQFLSGNPRAVELMISRRTVFFVDATDDPFSVSIVKSLFPQNAVWALASNIDCRVVNSNYTSLVELAVGNITVVQMSEKIQADPVHTLFKNYGNFHDQKHTFLLSNSGPSVLADSWKKLITLTSFRLTSMLFGEPNVASNPPLAKGIFQEVVSIANATGIKGIPVAGSVSAKNLSTRLQLMEQVHDWRRRLVCDQQLELPRLASSNKLFYDFAQGVNTGIGHRLSSLVNLARQFGIITPNMCSLHTFFSLLEYIHPKMSQVRENRRQSAQLDRALPLAKSMHFAPIRPRPAQINPIVYMSMINQNYSNNSGIIDGTGERDIDDSTKSESASDGASDKEMDSTLRDLIAGTEKLTYGEEYYDAPTTLTKTEHSVPEAATGAIHQDAPIPTSDMYGTQHQPCYQSVPLYYPQPSHQSDQYPPQFTSPGPYKTPQGNRYQPHPYFQQPPFQMPLPPPSLPPPNWSQEHAMHQQSYYDPRRPAGPYNPQRGAYNPGGQPVYGNPTMPMMHPVVERARSSQLSFTHPSTQPLSNEQSRSNLDATPSEQQQNLAYERVATPLPQPFPIPSHHMYSTGPFTPSDGARKKKRSFHHIKGASNRRTSAQALHKNHTDILDALHFNGLMDHSTSSRYGDLDTSSVILNSANNSRGSKTSSSSVSIANHGVRYATRSAPGAYEEATRDTETR